MILRKGRITKEMVQKVARFTSSINQDRVLAIYDIRQSIAHARALERSGVISAKDAEKLVQGLEKLHKKAENKPDYFGDQYEDIHMAVEEELGEIGKKLHAGRSRNDQVACDMRMYIRDVIHSIVQSLDNAIEALKAKDLKSDGKKVIMPAYTHLQRAQAVDLSTYLGVYRKWFERDKQRFADLMKRVNLLPLGSGAGASTNIKLDRQTLASELGFDGVMDNPMDAVSSRDYLIEFAGHAAILGTHLSRMAEELVLFSSREFSFVELDESIAETSSIMPQKKNPDCIELMRSASGRLAGTAVNLMTLMKGLPLTYNRDMQDDKAVFIAAETAMQIIDLVPDILNNISFNAENMRRVASEGFTDAADFAEYLVLKGLDFRTAHRKVGQLVKEGLERGYSNFRGFSLEELKKEIPQTEDDVFNFLDINNSVARRLHEK